MTYRHRDSVDTRESVERLANLVLRRHGIDHPPVDIDWIAEREGLEFADAEFAMSSGAYYRIGPGRGRALIAKRQSPLRRVFTKAHELAHHLLDEPTQTWVAGTDLQLPNAYRGRERHSNHEYFAGCLLMPRQWIGSFMRERGWMLVRPDLIETIARSFGVSQAAAEVRLVELGHIERGRVG